MSSKNGKQVSGGTHDAAPTAAQQLTATEALARIKPRAMALQPQEIRRYRTVPELAMSNVRRMKAALARFRGEMVEALPKLDLTRFDALEVTALALVTAANDADKVANDGEVQEQLAKAQALRGRILPVLHALAVNGHVPMKVYEDIAAGSGTRDVANDCVDLPAAFRNQGGALVGKHPLRDEDLAACEEVGSWLLRNLGTKGARPLRSAPHEAVDLRNRVATLLVNDYAMASVIAHYFLGDGYVAVVPPLRSRAVSRRAPGPAPEATSPEPPSPQTVHSDS
jgi:hypothetical protein